MAKEKRKSGELRGWKTVFGLVVVLWIAGAAGTFYGARYVVTGHKRLTLDGAGTFGDTFGAVNSLFSALAAAGVVFALILQTRELEAAREEARQAKDRAAAEAARQDKEAEINRACDRHTAMLSALIVGNTQLVNALENREEKLREDMFNLELPDDVRGQAQDTYGSTAKMIQSTEIMIMKLMDAAHHQIQADDRWLQENDPRRWMRS